MVDINLAKDDVQILQAMLWLTRPSHPNPDADMEDVVFVAIDSENANGITKRDALEYVNSQIGFAILDAKDLPSSTSPIVDIPNLQHRHRDFEISQKALAACPLKNEPLDSHQEELVKKLKTISR
ncbi:uncharacterized protein DFL_002293 [Arthrobotrys flagrans]|uniref:Uncharacterized protein n=1 Tax=Arthrobotrys flagrans TaxID=97331 RepID=A0A437AAA4_ARTFL|nr:hypothetical protein DFL_002293 [Arthrobotrys flagrans]